MLYLVSCTKARNRNASGIFYFIEKEIEANSAKEAMGKFREMCETCGPPLHVKEVNEIPTINDSSR